MYNSLDRVYLKNVRRAVIPKPWDIVMEGTHITDNTFNEDYYTENYIQFTNYQASLFNEKYDKTSAGRGEASIACIFVQQAYPQLFDEAGNPNKSYIPDTGIDTEELFGTRSKVAVKVKPQPQDMTFKVEELIKRIFDATPYQAPFDVINVFNNNKKYEVKEMELDPKGKAKSVQTGKSSFKMASSIYRLLLDEIVDLYDHYERLPKEFKNIFEDKEIKPGNATMSFDRLITSAQEYITNSAGEIPRGLVCDDVEKSDVPPLYLIPKFFNERFYNHELVKSSSESKPDSGEYLEMLYNLEPGVNTKLLDKGIRDLIKKYKLKQKAYLEGGSDISDFLLAVESSIFANYETYFDKVQSYFTAGTEHMREALFKTFPETGVFLVERKGYKYVGRNHMNKLLRIDSITRGKFKVALIK